MTLVTLESIQKSINDQTVSFNDFKAQINRLENNLDKLTRATKVGFDEMTERFIAVDNKLIGLDRGQTYLQKQVDAVVTHAGDLKKEVIKRPSRKEFNSLKKRVVILENVAA